MVGRVCHPIPDMHKTFSTISSLMIFFAAATALAEVSDKGIEAGFIGFFVGLRLDGWEEMPYA